MKNQEYFLYMVKLWRLYEEKLEEDAKISLEEFVKKIEKDKEKQEKLRFEFEHPELMPKILSPKEYGMKLIGKRKRK